MEWAEKSVESAMRGSKSRKILTGYPSSSRPFDSVWMKRKRNSRRNIHCVEGFEACVPS
jgi:hypothetical protein